MSTASLFTLLFVCLLAVLAFWIVGQMKPSEPAGLIVRVVVGLVFLLYILTLVPGGPRFW